MPCDNVLRLVCCAAEQHLRGKQSPLDDRRCPAGPLKPHHGVLTVCEHTGQVLHLEHDNARLLKLALDLPLDLRGGGNEPVVVVLDAVVRRVSAPHEEDLVPAA
ncbi:hypothetical protein GSI_03083 [Ganoderma sinense ZZ0214-1]|uniref:Uncharacterized protein n=1 Tax=Ganoderma sinense ZZ0214-1 TaxID=1077348 RepID=A0A2G8SL63_9APHY|nr:hypothetical protein GSI_03083 [Ganoderma sinense ZZ0214-1]